MRHRRLRQRHLLGGARERPRVSDGSKGHQPPRVHRLFSIRLPKAVFESMEDARPLWRHGHRRPNPEKHAAAGRPAAGAGRVPDVHHRVPDRGTAAADGRRLRRPALADRAADHGVRRRHDRRRSGDGPRHLAPAEAGHARAGAGDLRGGARHRGAQRLVRAPLRRAGADRRGHGRVLVGGLRRRHTRGRPGREHARAGRDGERRRSRHGAGRAAGLAGRRRTSAGAARSGRSPRSPSSPRP